MWRKYKYISVIGSGIVTFLALATVNAADLDFLETSAIEGKSLPPAYSKPVYSKSGALPSTAGILLADAARPGSTSRNSTAKLKPNRKPIRQDTNQKIDLENYQQLDLETERLLKDVLNLSSDLAILEEEQNTPAKHQLLVLVTMKPTKLFTLDYVELKIDSHTVAAYNYTPTDINALELGGGHRLYLALLPAGMHKLSATMAGRIPRDPDYNKAVDYSFVSGLGRTVVELIVSSEQSNSFPTLAVKEWNE